jgi:ATP-dependent DNA helicase RecG
LVPLAVTALKGVGPQVAKKLAQLGIHTVQDVLFHLPVRYQDRTRLSPIGEVRSGQTALIHGEVLLSGPQLGRRRSLVTVISDRTGTLTVRQFHFNVSQQRSLKRGCWIECFGEIRAGRTGPELIHPEYRLLSSPEDAGPESSLTPIYPTTAGLGQKTWRRLTSEALERAIQNVPELVPSDIAELTVLPTIDEALRLIHRPPPDVDINMLSDGVHPAQLRLAFEEMLAHHLAVRRRRQYRESSTAPIIASSTRLWPQLEKRLTFSLTKAQKRTIREVLTDLSQSRPSLRLIQGDVGCGKTVVAAAAALAAIEAGLQVVVMSPTELLAEQHFRTFKKWLEEFNLTPVWLTGKLGAKEKREVHDLLANGQAQIGVGTHALFQEDVRYQALGLVIVDEQHRFGVEQRLALREKGRYGNQLPHQLVMTATPIPRSLTMVLHADMDVSVIDEMPPGRKPVETVVIPSSRRKEVQERVRRACAEGQRAFWVCPLIDESDFLEVEAAIQRAKALTEELPDLRIALLHGKTRAREKETLMEAFRGGLIDLLVATTVIEVGVDVPEASLMVIENAERLGLAQLHQLRGRIGRGGQRAVCVLLYHAPISQLARDRLVTLRHTDDGFMIARKDLELRGPGEVLGTRQSGSPEFRIADFVRHRAAVEWIANTADQLLNSHPERADALIQRWLVAGDGLFSV